MYFIEHFMQPTGFPMRLINSHVVSDYCTRKLINSLKKQGYVYNRALKAYCIDTSFAHNRFVIHKQHIK